MLEYLTLPASDPDVEEGQTNTISVGISPGLVYFISPKIGIETTYSSIYYSNSHSKNLTVPYDVNEDMNSYGLNLNITTFYLGVHCYF